MTMEDTLLVDFAFGNSDEDSDYEEQDQTMEDVSLSSMDTNDDLIAPRPQLYDPSKVSVEQFKATLEKHVKNDTLHAYFTEVSDGDKDEFVPSFEPPADISGDWTLTNKLYGTCLQHACCDSNISRRNKKIQLIFDFATRFLVDMKKLLGSTPKSHCWISDTAEWHVHDCSVTPLWRLLREVTSTDKRNLDSIRIICEAWPEVLLMRDKNKLTPLLYACWMLNDSESLIEVMKQLFHSARSLPGGPLRLAQQAMEEDAVERGKPVTFPLHLIVDGYCRPNGKEQVISLILQLWPDALKYCRDTPRREAGFIDAPFHGAVKLADDRCFCCETYRALVKCAVAFLKHSTPEALVHALLYVNHQNESGLQILSQLVNYCGPDAVPHLLEELDGAVQDAATRQDGAGRTVLHYAAGFPIRYTAGERRVEAERLELLNRQDENARLDQAAANRLDEEVRAREVERRDRVSVLCEWIREKYPEADTVRDTDGLTPLDYALCSGKTWNDGLGEIARTEPNWHTTRWTGPRSGLYPFMVEASLPGDPDLSTIYELLRYDVHILSNV